MYRGTTPTITFKINSDIDLDDIDVCYVTFKSQVNNKTREYVKTDLVINDEEKTLTLALDQDDTLFFPSGSVQIQIRLRTTDDLAYASDIKTINFKQIIKNGVI